MTSAPVMTGMPCSRARRTSGVSAGSATTSTTVSARHTTSASTGRSPRAVRRPRRRRHADRSRVEDDLRAGRAERRRPRPAVALRQRLAGGSVARHHDSLGQPVVAQRCHARPSHPAAAEDGCRAGGCHLMGAQQRAHRQVVGVVCREPASVVDDRVDRLDDLRRRVQDVDEGDDVLLPRHRDGAAPDAQGAHPPDRTDDVVSGERLVDVVEVELVVEVVVKAGADVAGAAGQRDAQLGVLGDSFGHEPESAVVGQRCHATGGWR